MVLEKWKWRVATLVRRCSNWTKNKERLHEKKWNMQQNQYMHVKYIKEKINVISHEKNALRRFTTTMQEFQG